MPRKYTDDEYRVIREALIDAGRTRFAESGLEGVKIAELTATVGIGKGSFYKFFDSKEALFFAVHEAESHDIQRTFEAIIRREALTGAALLERWFLLQMELVRAHPFMRHLLDPGTLQALMARVPPAVVADHHARDRAWLTGHIRTWIEAGHLPRNLDPDRVFALSTAGLVFGAHRALIGEGYDDAARTIARAVARELAEGAPA